MSQPDMIEQRRDSRISASIRPHATRTSRARKGTLAHMSGASAEQTVARQYARNGLHVADARWRGASGEVDLVLRNGEGLVFVEVKQSRDFESAAARFAESQAARIVSAATEYLARMPLGQLTEVRFDLALVDRLGRVEIRENAFAA